MGESKPQDGQQAERKAAKTGSAQTSGAWSEQDIADYLRGSVLPVRLSCVAADGYPRVVSLWYQYTAAEIQCVTHRDSQLAGLLRRSPRVGFEIATNDPPYCGVRGQGDASLQALGEHPALSEMLQRYLGGTASELAQWLLSRRDEEILVTVRPRRLFSWDYRARMDSAEPGQ